MLEQRGASSRALLAIRAIFMPLIPIENLEDSRVDLYRSIKDAHLRAREGLFVVEGRENLRCMIESSAYAPLSALVSPTAYDGLEDVWGKLDPEIPIYRVPGALLRELAGFDLHRGCLALGARPAPEGVLPLIARLPPAPHPSCVLVLENLGNHDNVGGIFRTARALGADAVLMCSRSCDPLYRKAIRVSMGASLCVPWERDEHWPECVKILHEAQYATVALDPQGGPLGASQPLPPRVALFLGSEGYGLSSRLLSEVDRRMAIPMAEGIDSLNVTVAAGIALHAWRDGVVEKRGDS
jgi:tRNA G18 (ribose-2'-O)-methylase SpoU